MLFKGQNSSLKYWLSARKLRKSSPVDFLGEIRLFLMKSNKDVIRDALTVSGGDKGSFQNWLESVNGLNP